MSEINGGGMYFETVLPSHPFEFQEVNEFVHMDADYEDLKNLCLTMSASMEQERDTFKKHLKAFVFASSLLTSIACFVLYQFIF